MQFRVLYLVLLLNACCSFVCCLYLYMGETEAKCFIEDVAEDIKVVGNYRIQVNEGHLSAAQNLGMFVQVKDPDKKVILFRQYGSEGSFTFTSYTPGQHSICLRSNSSSSTPFSEAMMRVHLDIHVEKQMYVREKLTELQLGVQMLTEQVYQIQKENDYQRYRGQCFRQTSESTLQRVQSSILYTLIGLVALAFWKMREFKSLNSIEAEESEKSVKPDIFINVKPKELILPKCASPNVSYVRLQ